MFEREKPIASFTATYKGLTRLDWTLIENII